MKTTFVAVTKNDKRIERNSTKAFTHAYAVTWNGNEGPTGFASSEAAAQRAAANERSRIAKFQQTNDIQIEVMPAVAA